MPSDDSFLDGSHLDIQTTCYDMDEVYQHLVEIIDHITKGYLYIMDHGGIEWWYRPLDEDRWVEKHFDYHGSPVVLSLPTHKLWDVLLQHVEPRVVAYTFYPEEPLTVLWEH